ncbi:MAG TPA: hypothetical protein DD373_09840 [Halomonas sp.]|nr:hypothetical protein [Halomonas sp.]HBP78230.1 hypothetical protein [Halomonas sp.]
MAIEFNTEFYVQSKFNQLEATGQLSEFGLTDVASLAQFFEDNGVDAREHYLAVGMSEGIDPSAEFDTSAYLEAKLAQLQGEEFGGEYADFTVQDVIEAFQANGLTALEHFNQIGEAEGLVATPVANESSGLTEALSTYQTAVADERAFLEEATELDAVTGVDENSSNEDINDAIDTAVDTAAGQVDAELNNFKSYNFTNASAAVRAEIITEYRAKLEKDVADTKATVEETSGLLGKANTMVSAADAYEAAAAAVVEAQTDLTAEAAKFTALNSNVNATSSNGSDFLPATDGVTPSATDYSTYAVTATGVGTVIEVDGAKLVVTSAGEELEGIDALLANAQAEYQALRTEANAQTRLETAVQSVLAAENPDAVTGDAASVTITAGTVGDVYSVKVGANAAVTYTQASGDDAAAIAAALASSLGDNATANGAAITIKGVTTVDVTGSTTPGNAVVADVSFNAHDYYVELNQASTLDADGNFDAKVLDASNAGTLKAADSEAYFAAQTDLNDFNQAVQDFQAIAQVQSDSADLAAATATALEAVEAFDVELNVTGTGTEANDLFVYAEEAITISGFGLQGEDQLYIGEGFSEQRLADDVTDTRLGDSATLEVFFQQEGNNAAIYVENEAFAGNAANAADLTKITLTGVSIDDLQFENGFVSVIEAA